MQTRKAIAIPFIIGLIGVAALIRNPRFATFHTVDVLQLVASGMCWGVALMALVGRLKPRT